MTPRVRAIAAAIASGLAALLGVAAAWPIYQTVWLLVPAAAGLCLGWGVAAWSAVRRWGALRTGLVLVAAFLFTVVPVAVPTAFERLPAGLAIGLRDGLAAVALGWKQLLTLTLPVGAYQTMLVPAYVVFFGTAFTVALIALRGGRFTPLAGPVLLVPVAFGTIFGASAVSAPLHLGPLTVSAPREVGVWIATAVLGAAWVAFTAGAERRAAIRRGRVPGEPRVAASLVTRPGLAAGMLVVALGLGAAVAPALTSGPREVPRDRLVPELVVRAQVSPLAGYRVWKRDALIDAPLFDVASGEALPGRLRVAVLDAYDGVEFQVGAEAAGSFTRFPSGGQVPSPTEVRVTIGSGYTGIGVPTAGLGSAPVFAGPRAAELADAFFVNRATDAAIAVPGGQTSAGLAEGDGWSVTMSGAPDAVLQGGPAVATPPLGLDAMPELAAWMKSQDQPATADGLIELVKRLRERGYLSHALTDGEGERAWVQRLTDRFGTRFEASPGGHSAARLEQLFAQLNTQQRIAGPSATPAQLVAGVGDDEQFAAAAALLARALGFESRVVLGVRMAGGPEVAEVPSCSATCTGDNVAAWVEVRGETGEWAPLDVTPQATMTPMTLAQGEQLPQFPTAPDERDAREVDPPLGVGERSGGDPVTEPAAGVAWLWPLLRGVGLSLAALVLLALPVCFLPLMKRRGARARRGQGDAELRALGAWAEMVDRAADAGVKLPAGASRSEVADALGTAPARWAAAQIDRAVFAPGGVSDADADWVWQAVAADRLEREAAFSRWQRVRTRYSLRALLRRVSRRGAPRGERA